MSLYTDTTVQYLDLLKQAKVDCLQIAGSVKAAMTALAEKALDTAAAQDEKAAPVSVPRRVSKKTDPSA